MPLQVAFYTFFEEPPANVHNTSVIEKILVTFTQLISIEGNNSGKKLNLNLNLRVNSFH